ncbi:unnamed protein product [Trypanosoma congolense IL3000]|uniref:WGS project CAEQ00000000 data, annotated contig 1006 n=1 Tax=Trypanosoma congolense (strain IL3000) TaxID=1068625 RepID=F9W363_TRYCI|nr:unnamed protein product [Trypanosoma congolense IL3000]
MRCDQVLLLLGSALKIFHRTLKCTNFVFGSHSTHPSAFVHTLCLPRVLLSTVPLAQSSPCYRPHPEQLTVAVTWQSFRHTHTSSCAACCEIVFCTHVSSCCITLNCSFASCRILKLSQASCAHRHSQTRYGVPIPWPLLKTPIPYGVLLLPLQMLWEIQSFKAT